MRVDELILGDFEVTFGELDQMHQIKILHVAANLLRAVRMDIIFTSLL